MARRFFVAALAAQGAATPLCPAICGMATGGVAPLPGGNPTQQPNLTQLTGNIGKFIIYHNIMPSCFDSIVFWSQKLKHGCFLTVFTFGCSMIWQEPLWSISASFAQLFDSQNSAGKTAKGLGGIRSIVPSWDAKLNLKEVCFTIFVDLPALK